MPPMGLNMNNKRLEQLMGTIQEKMLENMLDDLSNPERCTPQLYNAIIKELQRNGIDCIPKAGEGSENALQRLLVAVRDDLEDEVGVPITVMEEARN